MRLSLKAKVLSLAVLPVLLFAVIISPARDSTLAFRLRRMALPLREKSHAYEQ